MNNKPLYLLNWLANVGLTEHLESQAPGALDILQRSANDLIGIVNTLSKITDTEKSEGLEDFLNEMKVAVTYLRPLMESSKVDRLAAGSFYFDNLNGAHPVQSIEQVWSRNVSIPTPQPTLDIQGVNQLVGGRPFDTGVADTSDLKKDMEKGTSEANVETEQAVAEQMPEPPAVITLSEPLTLNDALIWDEGLDLTIYGTGAIESYISELPTKPVSDANPIVLILKTGSKFRTYTRDKETGEFEQDVKMGKRELLATLAANSPLADAKLLAKVGRQIQSALARGSKVKITTHSLSQEYVYVIVQDVVKGLDTTYFTTNKKLAAYIPAEQTI